MARTPLIIDLDGTLWDSAPWYARLIAEDATELEALTTTFRGDGGGKPAAVCLRNRYGVTGFQMTCRAHIASLRVYDEAVVTLHSVRLTGSRLGVLTSLPAWVATPMLEALNLASLFDVVGTARRGQPPKPHPAGLRQVLSDMGIGRSDAIFLGDSLQDSRAAAQAGVRFIWALWGYGAGHVVGHATAATWPEVKDYL